MISRLLLLLIPFLLGACSTQEEKKTPPLMSQRMSERIASSRKRMGDMNDRSVFDKSMRASVVKGKDTGGWLGRQKYKSNSFTGSKSYTNTKSFKAGTFSGSDNKSPMGQQGFAQAGKTAPVANSTFETTESRFADDAAREGSQTYADADSAFKTSANRDARRSQIKNDRPKFIELDEDKKKPAYTEDQVRRLLGRN